MKNSHIKALILSGFGINCEAETAHAFSLAGATPEICHLNDLIANPERLHNAHIMAVPGGFSFGDDVASGKILANRLRYKLGDAMQRFVSDGKLVIGICNGFQVLVKMGLLPMLSGKLEQEVTLTHNDSGRFEDRWVTLKTVVDTKCVWLQGIDTFELPVRHGEGKFIPKDESMLEQMRTQGCIALRYCRRDGSQAKGAFPENPNGSIDDIAGICDATGRVFGLMPHPEAHVTRLQHPRWTREPIPEEGAGLGVFHNAVEYARNNSD